MNETIGIFVTITFYAFFSGMEIAFVSADKLRLEMDRKPGPMSSVLSYFCRHGNDYISTMLVGSNITLVIYGIFMADVLDDYLLSGLKGNDFLLLLLQTIIPTLIMLVTGEFLPKTLFRINPNLMLRVFVVPLLIIYIVLFPISKFSSMLSYLFLRMFGVKVDKGTEDMVFSKADLDYFVSSSIKNAENEEKLGTEVKIFQNALDFSEVRIRNCVVPRTEIVGIDVKSTTDELMDKFVESGTSKIIVYDGNLDNIRGYIHSSEMFRHKDSWTEYLKSVPIVPETMPAHRLMKIFMQQKKTIAVVVDEFGGTSGIVTMEDLIEEIFGDIEDEHDNTRLVCKQVGEGEYVLSARLGIDKVNEAFGLSLPESDDYQTVGGLILEHNRSFPKMHETVQIDRYQFKILKMSSIRIELVKLKVTE